MFLCWHRWGKWFARPTEKVGNHLVTVQHRRCEKCGIVKTKVQRDYNGY